MLWKISDSAAIPDKGGLTDQGTGIYSNLYPVPKGNHTFTVKVGMDENENGSLSDTEVFVSGKVKVIEVKIDPTPIGICPKDLGTENAIIKGNANVEIFPADPDVIGKINFECGPSTSNWTVDPEVATSGKQEVVIEHPETFSKNGDPKEPEFIAYADIAGEKTILAKATVEIHAYITKITIDKAGTEKMFSPGEQVSVKTEYKFGKTTSKFDYEFKSFDFTEAGLVDKIVESVTDGDSHSFSIPEGGNYLVKVSGHCNDKESADFTRIEFTISGLDKLVIDWDGTNKDVELAWLGTIDEEQKRLDKEAAEAIDNGKKLAEGVEGMDTVAKRAVSTIDAAIDRVVKEIIKIAAEIIDLESKLKALEENKELLESIIAQTEAFIETMKAKLPGLQEAVDRLTNELNALKPSDPNYERVRKELRAAQAALNEALSDIRIAQNLLTAKNAELKKLISNISGISSKIKDLKNDKELLTTKIETAKTAKRGASQAMESLSKTPSHPTVGGPWAKGLKGAIKAIGTTIEIVTVASDVDTIIAYSAKCDKNVKDTEKLKADAEKFKEQLDKLFNSEVGKIKRKENPPPKYYFYDVSSKPGNIAYDFIPIKFKFTTWDPEINGVSTEGEFDFKQFCSLDGSFSTMDSNPIFHTKLGFNNEEKAKHKIGLHGNIGSCTIKVELPGPKHVAKTIHAKSLGHSEEEALKIAQTKLADYNKFYKDLNHKLELLSAAWGIALTVTVFIIAPILSVTVAPIALAVAAIIAFVLGILTLIDFRPESPLEKQIKIHWPTEKRASLPSNYLIIRSGTTV